MKRWRLLSCWTADDQDLLGDWYGALDPEVQGRVDFYLTLMEGNLDWFSLGLASALDNLPDLIRVWMDVERPDLKKQPIQRYRMLGFIKGYPSNRTPGEFVILLGYQKGHGWTLPANAIQEALRIKGEIEKERMMLDDYSF